MAVPELIVSRRALLGAAWPLALAAPLRRQGPSPSSLDEQSPAVTKWDRALAGFRRAEARLVAAEGAADHLFDARNDAFHAALRRLMRTPAPGLPALAVKIDLAIDHEIWEFTCGESCLAALSRDARHFASPRSS